MEDSKGRLGPVFGFSRYLVLIAVIGLLLSAAAVLIFGGIMAVTVTLETFQHAEFNAESARLFSTELIELIDLFLLGTVLLITSIGLYQLFIQPNMRLPEWLSVANLEQLKFNLLAVIIVMLTVIFLGAAAGEWESGVEMLAFGGGIAAVILAISVAVLIFQRVHRHEVGHEHTPDRETVPVAAHETVSTS